MTTVVNSPGGGSGEGAGMGLIAGVLIAVVAIGLFVFFGFPAMRGNQAPKDDSIDVNIKLPAGNTAPDGSTQK